MVCRKWYVEKNLPLPLPLPLHTTYYLPYTGRGHGLFAGTEVAGRMAVRRDAPTFDL